MMSDDNLTYPYWAGRLSEVLRQILAGSSTKDYAAETLAAFDAWCENR